ncbi:hypothetical protein CBS101457_002322 [Exobasidium rhododendri]|nr:hypothetical protein CBS101457_002322 [Exobasidium rhododendri]
MNVDARSMLATVGPLLTLATALPHNYVPLQTDNGSQKYEIVDSDKDLKLVSPEFKGSGSPEEGLLPVAADKPDNPQLEGQCVRDANYTYYSDQQLIGETEKPILIEECDPSNPDQVRLAYVANKSYAGKLSPTSILIGCTTLQSSSFASKYGGAFKKVSDDNFTNFIRRDSNLGSSTLVKRRKAKSMKPSKRSTAVDDTNAKNEAPFVRRWETRSDVDQYSDGYHSCRSSNTAFCNNKIPVVKEMCLELKGALKVTLPGKVQLHMESESKQTVCDSRTGKCVETVNHSAGKTPEQKETTSTNGEAEGSLRRSPLKQGTLPDEQVKGGDHAEFMRRWLAGDDKPRSFMLRSEENGDNEKIQRRSIESAINDVDIPPKPRSWDDENDNGSRTDCSDVSDEAKPYCRQRRGQRRVQRNRNNSTWNKRSTAENQDVDVFEKRSHHSHDSWRGGNWRQGKRRCGSDGSDCRRRRDVQEDAGLEVLQKRDHHYYGRGRGRGCGSNSSRCRRDVEDDALTVRSALSEQGEMQVSSVLGKREEASHISNREDEEVMRPVQKRDLAISVWKQVVAPLLQRRSAGVANNTATTKYKREVA